MTLIREPTHFGHFEATLYTTKVHFVEKVKIR